MINHNDERSTTKPRPVVSNYTPYFSRFGMMRMMMSTHLEPSASIADHTTRARDGACDGYTTVHPLHSRYTAVTQPLHNLQPCARPSTRQTAPRGREAVSRWRIYTNLPSAYLERVSRSRQRLERRRDCHPTESDLRTRARRGAVRGGSAHAACVIPTRLPRDYRGFTT